MSDQKTDAVPSAADGGPVPTHVAIIMDGNGRWAAKRGLPRFEGHRRGVEAIRRAVRSAGDLGIRYLTVYSFSAENWRRVARRISLRAASAGSLAGLDVCFIFAPNGYDEPDILRS